MIGYINKFESMATKDGDGVRLAAFLSGCPLKCVYCHNPDICRENGKEYTAEEFTAKASRYKPYFNGGGGVTFSGGEPLLQSEFIVEAAQLLKKTGVGYVLDTSGSTLTEAVKKAIDGAELVILDLKFYNAETYRRYVGGDFSKVMEFAEYLNDTGKRFWFRTVIVPGINDNEKHIKKYAEIAKRWRYEKYELLAFHTLGFSKYEKLGLDNPLAGVPALSEEKLDELTSALNNFLQ